MFSPFAEIFLPKIGSMNETVVEMAPFWNDIGCPKKSCLLTFSALLKLPGMEIFM